MKKSTAVRQKEHLVRQNQLQAGDVVFILSKSPLGVAMSCFSNTPWNHVGIMLDSQFLIEGALSGCRKIKIADYCKLGEHICHIDVFRPTPPNGVSFSKADITRMQQRLQALIGSSFPNIQLPMLMLLQRFRFGFDSKLLRRVYVSSLAYLVQGRRRSVTCSEVVILGLHALDPTQRDAQAYATTLVNSGLKESDFPAAPQESDFSPPARESVGIKSRAKRHKPLWPRFHHRVDLPKYDTAYVDWAEFRREAKIRAAHILATGVPKVFPVFDVPKPTLAYLTKMRVDTLASLVHAPDCRSIHSFHRNPRCSLPSDIVASPDLRHVGKLRVRTVKVDLADLVRKAAVI
jgi:hypothetical protein